VLIDFTCLLKQVQATALYQSNRMCAAKCSTHAPLSASDHPRWAVDAVASRCHHAVLSMQLFTLSHAVLSMQLLTLSRAVLLMQLLHAVDVVASAVNAVVAPALAGFSYYFLGFEPAF